MKDAEQMYHGYRFPPTIISHAFWLYHRFSLSLRDVEDLLAKRGITVSYESIRQWCNRFGPKNARKLKKRHGRLGDTWYPAAEKKGQVDSCDNPNPTIKCLFQ